MTTRVENGQICLVEAKETIFRRPRSPKVRTSDPDPEFLLMMNVTKEEYLAKETQLVARVEMEDLKSDEMAMQVYSADKSSAEEPNPLALEPMLRAGKLVRARTGLRGTQDESYVIEMPKLMLDEEAIARVEAAAIAPFSPTGAWPPSRPPWELPRATRPEALDLPEDPDDIKVGYPADKAETPKEKSRYWEPVPEEERKAGVVYKESPIRELAKKHKLELSEDAIGNLEAAAKAARHNDHRRRWAPTMVDPYAAERVLVGGPKKNSPKQ
ncbi:unnamed protein product [Polarella glacialis]|uniref:Uncharacterized protein n=2 Tax=Polarella glacialis TaxID=89957 RepID=A0A813KW55_POLGL|nr:unnamed protein product [Polarella glacialis]